MPATQQAFEQEVRVFLGQNTAKNPADLDLGAQALAKNAVMREIGTIGKRDGSKPVTTTALSEDIKHLTSYQFDNSVDVGAAPTLSAVGDAASTLPSGTYYVRYTHVTDNGETEASTEASITLPPALTDPGTAPTLGESANGAETLPDQEYFVAFSWKNAIGETLISPEASFTVTAGNQLDVTIDALPTGATAAGIYIGTESGNLFLQDEIATTTYAQSEPISTVTAPPSENTAIATKLRVTVPAVPYHANSTNVYIATATDSEKLEGNTTTTMFDQSTALAGTGAAYPITNTTAFESELLAASGTSLYAYYNDELNAATMTDALDSSDIYSEDFTNSLLSSRLIIADTGNLKAYDGSAVADITPASDDPSPAPANVLTDINAKGNKYVWVHTGHVFVSPGTLEVFYSKRYEYDYFPETQYELLVRENDFVNGPGITYNNVCLIPMRRGWNILTGSNFDDFDSSQFLNTVNGVAASRSIARLTYPNGAQTVAFLSDGGVHEIFDTGALDAGVRQYATRSLMSDKIDFLGVGFTDSELSAAYATFDSQSNLYKLLITRDDTYYCYVLDVRDREWRLWEFPWNVKPNLLYSGTSYFAGSTGLLHKFDEDLYTDWDDADMSTGTAVDFDDYLGLMSFEFSGHASYLDYLLIEAKQWTVPSKLDVTLIYGSGTSEITSALKNEIFVWGVSAYAEAEWANTSYTDILNNAKRLIFKKKGKFFQVRMRNNRDEPVLIYKMKFIGRLSGK